MSAKNLARAAAILFGLWGVLHVAAAWQVANLAGTLEAGAIRGRVSQVAFFLLEFALLSMACVPSIWRISPGGYLVAAAATTAADIPFVLFLVIPGHVGLPTSVIGPSIWIAAVVLGALALRRSPNTGVYVTGARRG
ncbi:hypothetical protein ROJ8625_03706 [Roseivivax jejudonensis]|uniref:DoxX n=1 Tax=Roseivivax jejudonensis TaxID=1529041 RepID=A0A1X7A811_9RHOB|nr:hypothetical protein [Roseivivax jejudonensis]SLN71195.1 hypothetical protein ROJ8625_03706 [Roseivivax jejudonensis]